MSVYKQDGVNISAGDVFSRFVGELCVASYENSRFVRVNDLSRGNFRGPRGWHPVGLPSECLLTSVVDGIGTKSILIDVAEAYADAANDLIAMTAMDITRWGGLPLVFKNIFDVSSIGEVNSLTFEHCLTLMKGLSDIAKKHEYVLLTGETAELGVCVGSDNPNASVKFNWGGCMTGVYHPNKMILGDSLRPGQVVLVFQDTFRSNGLSSVRKALALHYGGAWWSNPEAIRDIRHCATPSAQYDRLLNKLHGWFEPSLNPLVRLHLVVHLSGGAFRGKFADLLRPMGLSAELDNLFDPPEIMRRCAEWRGMTDSDCYETWNGGQGALIVVDKNDVDAVAYYADKVGVSVRKAGRIMEKKEFVVKIQSKFDGAWVKYR